MPLIPLPSGGVVHDAPPPKAQIVRRRDVLAAFERVAQAIDRGLLPDPRDWALLRDFVHTRWHL